jgi:hypothetical protein
MSISDVGQLYPIIRVSDNRSQTDVFGLSFPGGKNDDCTRYYENRINHVPRLATLRLGTSNPAPLLERLKKEGIQYSFANPLTEGEKNHA